VSHKNEQAAKLFNSEVTELTVARRRLSLSGTDSPVHRWFRVWFRVPPPVQIVWILLDSQERSFYCL